MLISLSNQFTMRISLLIIYLINVGIILCEKDTTLLFLQILFRHGDRAPESVYPNDPNPVDSWREGLGNLTTLGKIQHYNLGKYLYSMYKDFVTSNPNEVTAFSSDVDRCKAGALITLSSLYSPDSNGIINEQIGQQPISSLYLPNKTVTYLTSKSDGVLILNEVKNILFSPEAERLNKNYKALYENLTIYSGLNITDYIGAFFLYDILYCERQHNLIIPEWAEIIWEELEKASEEFFFQMFNSPTIQRQMAGPYMQQMIETILKKSAGEIPEQKVQIYCAHDATILSFLSALDIYDGKRPPYCSTLIIELHENVKKEKLIRLLYINTTAIEKGPLENYVMKLKGCSEFCPLEYFINYVKHFLLDGGNSEYHLQ